MLKSYIVLFIYFNCHCWDAIEKKNELNFIIDICGDYLHYKTEGFFQTQNWNLNKLPILPHITLSSHDSLLHS